MAGTSGGVFTLSGATNTITATATIRLPMKVVWDGYASPNGNGTETFLTADVEFLGFKFHVYCSPFTSGGGGPNYPLPPFYESVFFLLNITLQPPYPPYTLLTANASSGGTGGLFTLDASGTLKADIKITVSDVFVKHSVARLDDKGRDIPDDKRSYDVQYKSGATVYAELKTTVEGSGFVNSGTPLSPAMPDKILTYTYTMPGDGSFDKSVKVIDTPRIDILSGTGTGTATVEVTNVQVNGVNMDLAGNYNYTAADGSVHTLTGSAGGLTTTAALGSTGSAQSTGTGYVTLPTEIQFDGLVTKLFNTNFGSGVNVILNWEKSGDRGAGDAAGAMTLTNGIYSKTITFQSQQITLDSQTEVKFNHRPIVAGGLLSAWLDQTWANSNYVSINPLDIGDKETQLHLLDSESWAVTDYAHASTTSIGGLGTGWTATNGSVSGALLLTASAAGAECHKTVTLDFRNYRYYRVQASCTVAQKLRIYLDSRYWEVDVTTSAQYFDLDLCNPTNGSAATDATDHSWTAPGEIYGVQSVAQIKFMLPASASTDALSVTLHEMRYTGAVRGWVMPSECKVESPYGGIDDWFPQGGSKRYARLLTGLPNWKQGPDIPHAVRNDATDTTNYVLAADRLSIDEMITLINAQTGITATASSPLTSPNIGSAGNYYTGALFAAYLTLDTTASRVSFSSPGGEPDLSSKSLRCWPRYIAMEPVYGLKCFYGTLKTGFTKRLYTAAHGLVVKPGAAVSGESVVISGGASSLETVTTNSDGYYRSSPRMASTASAQGMVQRGSDSLSGYHFTRHYHWGGFRKPADTSSSNYIWAMRDYTYILFVLYVDVANGLMVREWNPLELAYADSVVDSDLTCSCPSLHLCTSRMDGVYLRGTEVRFMTSMEHGRSWVLSAISGAYAADFITSRERLGQLIVAYWHPSAADGHAIGWYIQVGDLQTDGSYSWSTPVSLNSLTAANSLGKGCLLAREDGSIEFHYLDNAGLPQIIRCGNLDIAGNGTWV